KTHAELLRVVARSASESAFEVLFRRGLITEEMFRRASQPIRQSQCGGILGGSDQGAQFVRRGERASEIARANQVDVHSRQQSQSMRRLSQRLGDFEAALDGDGNVFA